MTGQRTTALIALVGALLCWSSVPLFLKYFTVYLDAWSVNGVRYGLAAIILFPAVLTIRNRYPSSIWKDAMIPAAIVSAVPTRPRNEYTYGLSENTAFN